jgi:hypothetical protein
MGGSGGCSGLAILPIGLLDAGVNSCLIPDSITGRGRKHLASGDRACYRAAASLFSPRHSLIAVGGRRD